MNLKPFGLRFPFLGAAALAGILSGCGIGSTPSQKNAQEAIVKDAKAARSQLDQLKGVTLKGGELAGGDSQGRPLWRLSAREIRVFNQPDTAAEKKDGKEGKEKKRSSEMLTSTPKRAELFDARATLYREGEPDTLFEAPRIAFNQRTEGVRLSLSGDIRVQSQGSWTGERGAVIVTSPQAEVDIENRRFWAGRGVRLVQGTGKEQINAIATQLNADTNLKATQLSGDVKIQNSRSTFRAREANWNWETERILALGEVSVLQGTTTITGARLDADTRAGHGTLSGGVRVEVPQGKASAKRVRYNRNNKTIVASGDVLLTKEGLSLRASEVSADDGFANAKASGGVVLTQGKSTLKAAQIETKERGARATASGNVVLNHEGATVSAPRATVYEIGEKNARIEASGGVRLQREGMTISASQVKARGVSDKSTLHVEATGKVKATSSDGSIEASRVVYHAGTFTASQNVTLIKDGHRLTGAQLTADEKLTTATLSGNVTGRLAQGETIGAGKLIYRKGARLEGEGGVKARRGDLQLRADKMSATLDGAHILLTGNVVVTNSQGVTLRSNQARYDRAAGKVFASGEVFIEDSQRGLQQRGRGLVADLQLKEATLTDVSGSGKMELFQDKKLFD